MKRYFLICLIIMICFSFRTSAQTEEEDGIYRFGLGIQLGSDIGGAIPFPFKHIPSTYNPYPKLNLSLGAKFTFPVKPQWELGTEVTYKTIAIDADARVKNQRFKEKEHIQYFTGSAKMHMEFTMLEFPLYVKYRFKNGKDRVLGGPFSAWIIDHTFVVDPIKGFVGMGGPDIVDAEMPDDMEDMVFSESLDNWDLGLMVGYERQLSSRIELGLRFMWGFKNIFKKDDQYFDYSMLHMRGTVVLSYNLVNIKTARSSGKKR